MLLLVS
jgi:hypothetical protein